MAQRGRKSAATLAAIASIPVVKNRMPPPDYLGAAEAEAWVETMNAFAAGWFTAEDVPLLETYVAAVALNRRLMRQLEDAPLMIATSRGGAPNPLFRMQSEAAHSIAYAAAKLRISKSARYESKTAAKNAKSGPLGVPDAMTGEKPSTPWQTSA